MDKYTKLRHKKLLIPVELSRYVIDNNLVRPFSVYLHLKLFSDGKLHQDKIHLTYLDPRTFHKHLTALLTLNWVGYNPHSGTYFIRSIDFLRHTYDLRKRTASTLTIKDLKQLQVYLTGVILSAEVKAQKFYFEKKRKRAAVTILDAANQSASPSYFGLSQKSIGDLMGCKSTRSSVLKNAAAKHGYIRIKHRFKLLATLPHADMNAIPNLKCLSKYGGRLRITKNKDGQCQILIQTHDEIIPKMKFKTIRKFSNLKI